MTLFRVRQLAIMGVAAATLALPAWLAVTEHAPAPSSVRLVPLTVQTPGVVDARVTVRPEDDVATSAIGAEPKVWFPGEAKVMVCGVGATEKLCWTSVAAA